MPGKTTDPTVAHQVELAISQLDSLSTLPSVAAQFFSKLFKHQFSPSALAEIIESDPALTARILSVMHQQGLSLYDEKLSIRQALDKLPAQLVRDSVLSVEVFQDLNSSRAVLKKGLALHALAVACCAKNIAEIISPKMDSQLAYSAGLLHDIGKFALEQAMPKSFARIIEEAKSQNAPACSIEQKHLGTNHTILGKRLAGKWHLPNQITMAIWLHHSNTNIISASMPEARIAQIIQLADSTARQCGIGQSGNHDSPDSAEQIALLLSINPGQLEQIRRNLPDQVAQKSQILGLDSPNAAAAYCDIVHTTAVQLARQHTELSLENHRLQSVWHHFDFITDFLVSINSATEAIDAAENFAVRWQKFFQTGPVCLYLAPADNSQFLEAVIIESPSQTKKVYLNAPAEIHPVPQGPARSSAILNAHEYADWLFEQLDVEFDLNQTKLAPLISAGKAVGAIVFELRHPADTEKLEERFRATTSIAASILDMAFTSRKQQRFAEQFAQLLSQPQADQQQQPAPAPPARSLNALAEMAAGAAHELNNPLSVISGRAQLLGQTETDLEKTQILKQIQENTNEIAAIIDDLMTFAAPPQPRPSQIDIKQILDEATYLAAQKTNVEKLDVQIEVAETSKNVFVDSAQIVSAIANIFSNSLESYSGEPGPIKVTAEQDESGESVKLVIADFGCGMDPETLQKATQPFFSAKPAGRKRGMGLAHAQRTIQLNKGSLRITSQPDSGTTVTIYLPCK